MEPKAQWDRYIKMKLVSGVRVGVRVNNGDDKVGEWLEVGKVKSENDELVEATAALQRALIAGHAKRLQPLKVIETLL